MDSSVFTHSKPNDLSAARPLQMWNGICRPVLFRVHFSRRALYQFPNRVHSLTDNVCEDWAGLLGRSAGPGEGPPESLASGLESARRSISFCTICQIVFVQLKTVGYLHLVVRLSSRAGIALAAPVRLFFGAWASQYMRACWKCHLKLTPLAKRLWRSIPNRTFLTQCCSAVNDIWGVL